MSVYDYSGCIKITFDKPIVVEPSNAEIIEFAPEKLDVTDAMLTVSSTYGGQPKAQAVDKSLSTRWETSGAAFPQWLTADLRKETLLGKIRVYMVQGQYPVSAFTIQGSSDNSTWVDIYSGTIANATAWTDIAFTPAAYRYWRFLITAGTSGYACIYEIEYWPMRRRIAGWEVTGEEPDMSPAGVAQAVSYIVRSVTRDVDNMSVFLWLDLNNRMRYPQGPVNVKFTGSLVSLGYANVEPFERSFTPTNITKIFHPNDPENLTSSVVMTLGVIEVSYQYGKLEESVTVTTGASITATNVSGLPL